MSLDPFPKPLCSRQKPEIDYPCTWLYKVIGRDAAAIERAVAGISPRPPKSIAASHSSSGGKYISLNVEIEVMDEDERLAVYTHLKNHAAVKAVL